MKLYPKNGGTDFNELWDIDSSNGKGIDSLVMSKLG